MQDSRSDETHYSIRVTAQLTGISVDQLRVWERRYGFPAPERDASGMRCYSQGDIDRLRLISRALGNGWRARDAVLLQPQDLRRLLASLDAGDQSSPLQANGWRDSRLLVGRLQQHDVEGIRLELRALAARHGALGFVVSVAVPLLREVGAAWARGEIEVRHEHLMTELLSSQLRLLVSTCDREVPGVPRVLLATLPGEQHGLGLEMVALYLTALGGGPRLMGTDTPVEQIVRSAAELAVEVVGVTISGCLPVRGTRDQVLRLRAELSGETALWLGGAGARAIAADVKGSLLVEDIRLIEQAVERCRAR